MLSALIALVTLPRARLCISVEDKYFVNEDDIISVFIVNSK